MIASTILISVLLGLCISATVVFKKKKKRGGEGGYAAAGLIQGIGSDQAHWKSCVHEMLSPPHMDPSAAGDETETAEEMLARVRGMVPPVLDAARAAAAFPGRWKAIAAKLERLPPCLSDLSSHPCFARNALCRELLQSVADALAEAAELAARCREPPADGKLRTQSAVDALAAKLDLNLRDCALLVKTGVLSDASAGPSPPPPETAGAGVRELLARLQIGHAEAKSRAVDGLLEALRRDEKSVLSVLGRANVSALVQLLTASSPKVREKAAVVVCRIAESCGEGMLVSEGVLPPLVRLAESGSLVAREKAALTLQRLSATPDTARAVVGHGGPGPLVEICQTGDSVSQSAAAGALNNLSAVPELRQALADQGVVRVMVGLLERGCSKERAAECLQNLTSGDDGLRRAVVSEGGLRGLLLYLDGPSPPQEAAVGALRNVVGAVSPDSLVSLGVLPRLAHVLRVGSVGAQQQAAAAICAVVSGESADTIKRVVGEHGCVPLLVRMLEAKSNAAREVASQTLASLASCPHSAREMKKDDKCVPNLVQLLDPSPANTAKKYAILCLLALASTKRCKKLMISHGAIGYLKKLSDMNVAGANKLLERLERGGLRSLFSTSSK